MNIALVDDDADFLAQTARLLALALEQRGTVGDVKMFASAEELLEAFRTSAHERAGAPFDLYFLDVVMPGLDGIALARRIRQTQLDAPIVFLTTSTDFALEAYSVDAADYVVKPFSGEALARALDRAFRRLASIRPAEMVLKGTEGFVRLPISEIVTVEAAGHYQVVHLVGGRLATLCLSSLQEFWEKLSEDARFIRVGRQQIVNLEHVISVVGGSLRLTDQRLVEVPRRVFPEVKAAFLRFYRA